MKPSVPDVIADFRAYHTKYSEWGSLHVVLSDGNYQDHFVHWCIGHAKELDDQDGERLASILLTLSQTQRRKLSQLA